MGGSEPEAVSEMASEVEREEQKDGDTDRGGER